ncbi:MAG: hypothetical protein CVV30_00395 [Methanomicrobiales archaeon HGW-Methanomicrobiales-1]|jgi:hypothetical protein|nr:MAG: hypothetical protein CVV30_00395 [Methanomicrobiales archaeon HGW-Methanomicrobiales-1]
MQLTAAMQRSDPVHGLVLSIAQPVLSSPSVREITTAKKLPVKAGRINAPPAASIQDSIPVSPVTLPVLPDSPPAYGPAPTIKRPVAPPKIIRPGSAKISRRLSKNSPFVEQDIPLYLVPAIIARAIWQRGELMFRISVIRTKQHYYTIRLRTARPGTGAGNKSCGKSRSGTRAPKNPGKNSTPQPLSKPAEMPGP